MDTPIKPRIVKPRVHQRPVLVWQKYWSRGHQEELADRVYLPRYVCYDDNVRAVGKTIEGAYKNWVSLKIDRVDKRALNYRAKAAGGVSLAAKALFVLSSDRDYK